MNEFVDKIRNLGFVRKFGDLNGFIKFFVIPVLIVVLAVAMIVSSLTVSFSDVLAGRGLLYSQAQINQYAETQYAEQFAALKDTEDFEDCLLLVVYVDSQAKEYYAQARVGKDIPAGVTAADCGQTVVSLLKAANTPENQLYKETFSEKLAVVVKSFASRFSTKGTDYEATAAADKVDSVLIDNANMEIAEADKNAITTTLQNLTDRTGVPVVVVVANGDEVFGSAILTRTIIAIVLAVALIAGAAFLIFKGLKGANVEQAEAPAEEQAEAPAEAPAEEQTEAPAEEE